MAKRNSQVVLACLVRRTTTIIRAEKLEKAALAFLVPLTTMMPKAVKSVAVLLVCLEALLTTIPTVVVPAHLSPAYSQLITTIPRAAE